LHNNRSQEKDHGKNKRPTLSASDNYEAAIVSCIATKKNDDTIALLSFSHCELHCNKTKTKQNNDINTYKLVVSLEATCSQKKMAGKKNKRRLTFKLLLLLGF
jgi:hypothetical protein